MSKANNPSGAPMTPAQLAAQGIKQAQTVPGPSTAVQDSLNQLARFLQRPTVKGLYYNGKKINVDGYEFVECRFDNCTLVVSGTNFEIVRCVIDVSTSIEFGPNPMKVIRLYNTEDDPLLGPDPEFRAIRNPDGSVTVHGEFYG